MLAAQKAFSSFSVDDLDKAQAFYSEKLGIKATKNEMGILDLDAAGHQFIIYPKPNHQPASFTVLNLLVADLETAVDALIAAGITFEQYDNEYMKTDAKGIVRGDGRGPDIAWFKDPAGNILSLIQKD